MAGDPAWQPFVSRSRAAASTAVRVPAEGGRKLRASHGVRVHPDTEPYLAAGGLLAARRGGACATRASGAYEAVAATGAPLALVAAKDGGPARAT